MGEAAPTPAWIEDLSDAELRARLEQRGLAPGVIAALVDDRDTAGGAWRIAEELDR